jgi:hypothetical protein
MAQGCGGQQGGDGLEEFTDFLAKTFTYFGLDVFLRKIDPCFDPCQKIKESFAFGVQTVA